MLNLANYPIPEDAYRLKDFLDGVLQTVVSVFESNGMPLPARRYWTMAAPTIDCEQVVVSLVNTYLGAPGDEASRPLPCESVRSAVVTISIARQAPIMRGTTPPSADDIQNSADVAAIDTWILMENLSQFDLSGPPGRGLGVIATSAAQKVNGGYQEVRVQLTLAVP